MNLFQGAGVALVTPFHEDKTVNYVELKRMIEYQIENKTDAIIVCGTTGEPATMTEEERLEVISFVTSQVNKRIPVIAGTGGNSTQCVIAFSKKVQEIGVDGCLIVTPYYNKATQNGLYEHYKAIANAIALPIIMYNVPGRTAVNLLPDTAVRLSEECVNIVAVKEASGNISQIADLLHKADGKLAVYSGNDDQILPILALGGAGVISVLSNVAPRDTHDMVLAYLEGNLQKARNLQMKYLDLIHALFCEVNPIPVKKAMECLGFQVGGLRLPLTELEKQHVKLIQRELEKIQDMK